VRFNSSAFGGRSLASFCRIINQSVIVNDLCRHTHANVPAGNMLLMQWTQTWLTIIGSCILAIDLLQQKQQYCDQKMLTIRFHAGHCLLAVWNWTKAFIVASSHLGSAMTTVLVWPKPAVAL